MGRLWRGSEGTTDRASRVEKRLFTNNNLFYSITLGTDHLVCGQVVATGRRVLQLGLIGLIRDLLLLILTLFIAESLTFGKGRVYKRYTRSGQLNANQQRPRLLHFLDYHYLH